MMAIWSVYATDQYVRTRIYLALCRIVTSCLRHLPVAAQQTWHLQRLLDGRIYRLSAQHRNAGQDWKLLPGPATSGKNETNDGK
jgi:hypothetical protein